VPELIRLQDKLPQVKELISPVVGSKIEVSIEVANNTQAILLDYAELELALLNLAINARDAMPEGGSFRITARNAGAESKNRLQDTVVIEAVDTGSGIDEAVIEKVFEPFFTTKPLGEGTGLGLSQVYGLCMRGGGSACITSRVGVGTRVSLFLPGMAGAAADGQRTQKPTTPMLRKTVLVVEDNDQVAQALVAVLEELGCTVTRLSRAQAACQWLHEHPDLPDVVLSDVVMPGAMDGLALAEHISLRHPFLPIVLMTGYSEQLGTIERAGFDVIPKPCSAEVLAAGILSAIQVSHAARAALSEKSRGTTSMEPQPASTLDSD
jgi:CheY-like chemotaxis protein